MKILYTHDNVYYPTAEGMLSAGQFSHEYWQPYLEAFGSLTVLGREGQIVAGTDTSKYNRADGENIKINVLPNMNSVKGQISHRNEVVEAVKKAVQESDGLIIRAMSEIGWIAYKEAKRVGIPIAHELSGCPWDNTWNHGSLIAKMYAPLRYLRAKKVARTADQVLYVTRDFLPKRYPATGQTAIASNVRIETPQPEILEKRIRKIRSLTKNKTLPVTFGIIGHLDHRLKGIDIALKAMARYQKSAPRDFRLRILGPGSPQKFKAEIHDLGLQDRVSFDGVLPAGDAVLKWLDDIDIYLQPSFHEGLPRALIEAMSRGCPALASTAGGIAELLSEECLHKPGDDVKLALDIRFMTTSGEDYLIMRSQQNFETTMAYTQDKLNPVRKKFWNDFAKRVQSKLN